MRISIEISEEECMKLREHFKFYGTVQPLLNQTGIHRMTLSRLLNTRRATRDTIEKIRLYLKDENI